MRRDVRERTLWCREVDDVAVALEHVDLLDGLDGLDVQLLKRGLKLLVVGAGALVDLLDLPARSTLASVVPSQSRVPNVCALIGRPLSSPVVFGMVLWVHVAEMIAGWSRLEERFAYPVARVSQLPCIVTWQSQYRCLIVLGFGATYQCAPTPAYAPTWPGPYLR
jgi:hypothetical protein